MQAIVIGMHKMIVTADARAEWNGVLADRNAGHAAPVTGLVETEIDAPLP
jgi:hypothetical protein